MRKWGVALGLTFAAAACTGDWSVGIGASGQPDNLGTDTGDTFSYVESPVLVPGIFHSNYDIEGVIQNNEDSHFDFIRVTCQLILKDGEQWGEDAVAKGYNMPPQGEWRFRARVHGGPSAFARTFIEPHEIECQAADI